MTIETSCFLTVEQYFYDALVEYMLTIMLEKIIRNWYKCQNGY